MQLAAVPRSLDRHWAGPAEWGRREAEVMGGVVHDYNFMTNDIKSVVFQSDSKARYGERAHQEPITSVCAMLAESKASRCSCFSTLQRAPMVCKQLEVVMHFNLSFIEVCIMKCRAKIAVLLIFVSALMASASQHRKRAGCAGDSEKWLLDRSIHGTDGGWQRQWERRELEEGDEVLPRSAIGRVLRLEAGEHGELQPIYDSTAVTPGLAVPARSQ